MAGNQDENGGNGGNGNTGGPVLLLLLVPMLVLYVPFYNRIEPTLFGFPFFYWYQFAWVPITALLTWIVYKKVS